MTNAPQSRPPIAGGALLACALFIGIVVGFVYGQVTIGFLVGLGAGLVALALVALFERRRR